MHFNKKLIIIIILIVLLTGITLFFLLPKLKEKKQIETNRKIESLNNNLNKAIGGNINEDGFQISYLESDKVYVVTVTKNPFNTYKDSAFRWLKDQGVNPNDLPHICMITRGVNTTTQELESCSNTTIK